MSDFNGVNYTLTTNVPSEKVEKGEIAGRKRLVREVLLLATATAVGDKIYGPSIPAGSIVTDAKIVIDKSLGATGIFMLGNASDDNAYILAADAGGQAVLQRAVAGCAGIHVRTTAATQLICECTEIMDGTVLDGTIYMEVEYVND